MAGTGSFLGAGACWGDPTGVKDSIGGGVSSSTSGRSCAAEKVAATGEVVATGRGAVEILFCSAADKPLRMASSTARFRLSIASLRVFRSASCASSSTSFLLFVSRSCSRPVIRALRALMLSATAPSASASFLQSAASPAACMGGDGIAAFGLVSFS